MTEHQVSIINNDVISVDKILLKENITLLSIFIGLSNGFSGELRGSLIEFEQSLGKSLGGPETLTSRFLKELKNILFYLGKLV